MMKRHHVLRLVTEAEIVHSQCLKFLPVSTEIANPTALSGTPIRHVVALSRAAVTAAQSLTR